ncbi:MAG: PQQ-binding-like beta-propeller repeat protein [Bauldia sp.]|nr:PQQ-binding-like beta-propeller repeat protein [Bauldia sp.]
MSHTLISRRWTRLGVVAATLLAGTSLASAEVTYERLLNPEPENWLMNHRTFDSNRYSPLDEINTGNAGDLKIAFAVALAPSQEVFLGGGLQGTPVVDNGIMYMVDSVGRVYRIDLTAGDRGFINWIMDPETDPEVDGIQNNRGVALFGDNVYSVTRDGFFVSTEAATGEVVWQVATEQNPVEYFTMAPLALEDRLIMGPAGGDGPMRGRIEARSPDDGSLLWTFWTIPGEGEPGNETWGDGWETGGVGLWVTGSYDPATNTLFYGTGNPSPFGDPTLRPGDNLYSSATVALDAETGALKWYFQYTPNEQWDYDEVGVNQIYTIDGETVIGHFARNGFYYNLNATDGTYLNGAQYVDQVTWTAGIDPKTGMPVEYNPDLRSGGVQQYAIDPYATDNPTLICPNIQGGTNMFPTTYSERTSLVYASAIEGCNAAGGPDPRANLQTGSVIAVDITTGEVVEKHSLPFVAYGGNVSTAGGLVFGNTINGDFFAMDDETLDILWNINIGTPIEAGPISFAINGKQYIAVAAGAGSVSMNFSNYPARGDDPNAASLANMQRASMLYFFSL